MINSTLRMIKSVIDEDWDYIHFLTGQDLPLMDPRYFREFFSKHDRYNFIEFKPEYYDFAHWKCDYRHFFVENRFYRNSTILKALSHSLVHLQKLLSLQKRSVNLYHGSAYFSITKELALDLVNNRKLFEKLYKRAIAADEVWLQTYVMNSDYKKTIYKFERPEGNLRYIDWKRRQGNSPYTFTERDFDSLKQIINTEFLLGRKFDERQDYTIIDQIYESIR